MSNILYIDDITDYSQIANDFSRLFHDVTGKKFNANVAIMDDVAIRAYVGEKKSARIYRHLFSKDSIYIRQMPIGQMFYELSHEAGHNAKPHFDNVFVEETKSCLFQYCFSKKVKESSFVWLDDFILFEKIRILDIQLEDPEYFLYHQIAQHVADHTDYDFNKGANLIKKIYTS